MGEHVDRLVALSAVEHVKAYTKKDGTHVSAHERTGTPGMPHKPGHAAQGGYQDNVPYDPSNPAHPKPKFAVGDTVVKGNGKKLWIVRDRTLTRYASGKHEWSFAVKNYDTGKSSSLLHTEHQLNPAHEGADAQAQGEAQRALKEKLSQHTSAQAKTSQSASQGQSMTLEGKVVKYSTKRPNKLHPKPIESDTIDGSHVVDKRLKQLPDGSFKWEYLLSTGTSQGRWWHAK
jgi:hypothetical protein